MKVIVCGGREFGHSLDTSLADQERARNQRKFIYKILDLILWNGTCGHTTVIHGCQRGADVTAECWAQDRGFPVDPVPADWNRFGKAAGHIRNGEMLTHKPDFVIAFPGGPGTQNMIDQAKAAKVPVLKVEI